MIEALIYGVIDKANIVNLLNDPPEKVSMIFNMPLVANTELNISGFTPGTGMNEPKRTNKSISKVKIIFFLISLTLRAFFTVSNILYYLNFSSGSFNFIFS